MFGVIFDWGGTLSLPRDADRTAMWLRAARVLCPPRADELARLLTEHEAGFWTRVSSSSGSGTLAELIDGVLDEAGVEVSDEVLDEAVEHYLLGWDELVEHRAETASALQRLRANGLRIGMLSNTHWPRAQHERFLRRDGIDGLIDVAVYSSECPWTKPDPRIFLHAAHCLGAPAPQQVVYVGDRPVDDVEGAQRASMRAILLDIGLDTGGVAPDGRAENLEQVADIVLAWAGRFVAAGGS